MLFTVIIGICGTVGASLLAQKWRAARLSVWFFIPLMCQCLAWVILPVAIMFGARSPRDDATNFMQHTGWQAPAVLLIGLAVVASCAVVLRWAFKRGRAMFGVFELWTWGAFVRAWRELKGRIDKNP